MDFTSVPVSFFHVFPASDSLRKALALRAPAVHTSMDVVETQEYNATQAAMEMKLMASPILIEDSLYREETSSHVPHVNRSLAREFSAVNLRGWVSYVHMFYL